MLNARFILLLNARLLLFERTFCLLWARVSVCERAFICCVNARFFLTRVSFCCGTRVFVERAFILFERAFMFLLNVRLYVV